MKVYNKSGMVADATKEQWPALEAAGWSRKASAGDAPVEKEETKVVTPKPAEKPVVEKKEVEETPEEKPSTTAGTKLKRPRKPIAKKTDKE